MKFGGRLFLRNIKHPLSSQIPTGKFIILKIFGGLGSQMFQYACAKAFAELTNSLLILDTSYFNSNNENQTYRKYKLSTFLLDVELLTDEVISKLPEEINIFKEDRWCKYEECLFEMETPCYLNGYWQSWKYFQSIRQKLYEDFCLSELFLSSVIKKLATELSQEQSVGIYIRRKDSSIYPHGILPLHYYQHAISYLKQKIICPVFYIFSDDPDWVVNNFDMPKPFRVIKGNTDIEDMYLMSQCKHNIIANSTFSWWAAWLNSNPDKIVVIPQKWIINENLNVEDTDLTPPGWISF